MDWSHSLHMDCAKSDTVGLSSFSFPLFGPKPFQMYMKVGTVEAACFCTLADRRCFGLLGSFLPSLPICVCTPPIRLCECNNSLCCFFMFDLYWLSWSECHSVYSMSWLPLETIESGGPCYTKDSVMIFLSWPKVKRRLNTIKSIKEPVGKTSRGWYWSYIKKTKMGFSLKHVFPVEAHTRDLNANFKDSKAWIKHNNQINSICQLWAFYIEDQNQHNQCNCKNNDKTNHSKTFLISSALLFTVHHFLCPWSYSSTLSTSRTRCTWGQHVLSAEPALTQSGQHILYTYLIACCHKC